MYSWIWRQLPGPLWAKVLIATALVAAVIVACFVWVFPALAPLMPFNDQTVE